MEENNYRNEFELFLKESADEFKMVPSRKVWYSLYNNLHPDKKWPSMAVCLLILTAVLYIGISNNNSISNAASKASSENFSNVLHENNIGNTVTFSANDYIQPKNKKQKFTLTVNKKGNTQFIEDVVINNIENPLTLTTSEDVSVVNTGEISPTLKKASFSTKNDERKNVYVFNADNKKNPEVSGSANDLTLENTPTENNGIISGFNINIHPTELVDATLLADKIFLLNIEKSWKEDYAFKNKPAINKFKQNSSLSYYLTPSFGYRTFAKTTEEITPALSSSFSAARTNNDATVLFDNAALNLEAGAILQYNISKNIRLKVGLQANYTNYVSNVTALGHPSLTTITLNNNSANIRSSNYSTKAGNDKINKTTMQVALPLGADIKIAGNKKINWYAGGSIQPTYVISGNAFVLSTDEKYYISENALLRKMNLNTSIETFISFKSSNGVILHVGPQLRYQLLSTYKKEYGYSEKVYNVGLKIGVSTTF